MENKDVDAYLLTSEFAMHSQINDMYKMIIDINEKRNIGLTYNIDVKDGKVVHILKTYTNEYKFNNKEEICDFLLTNYGC